MTASPAPQSPTTSVPRERRPDWLRVHLQHNEAFRDVRRLLGELRLSTVCEEAACPNRSECWSRGTATLMILGDTCTRSCGFCNVRTGRPRLLDPAEPVRVAQAVRALNLRYVVITSVDRDDLPDGGAAHFAATIRAVHETKPECRVEVLIPDFRGSEGSLDAVCAAQPDVLAHNLETAGRLYPAVRPQARYWRSLQLLGRAKRLGMVTKSGMMVGLGETLAEVVQVMRDLVEVGCRLMTIGQYLQPSPQHLPVIEFVHPDVFAEYAELGKALGLRHVQSGPLVRSSYRAEAVESLLRSAEYISQTL